MEYGSTHTRSRLVTMEYPWVAQETQNNKRNTEMATKIVKPHARKNIPVVVNLDNFTAEDIGALDAELSNNFPCWRRDHGLVSVDVENFPVYKNTGTRTDVSLNLAIGHGVKLRPEDDAIRTGIVDETIALVSIDLLPTRQLCFRFIISYYKNNHSKAKSLHHMDYLVDLEPETSDVRIAGTTVNDEGKLIVTTTEGEHINTEVVVEQPLTEAETEVKRVTAPLDIPGLASGAIGKELFEDVAQILRTDYPMWELEDGKVYISENFQAMAEAIVTYRAAHIPTSEIISFPINAHTLHQLLRRNYDSGVGVQVDEDFDIDNPNHKFNLLDIYICSDSETPQIGFIFQVFLITRHSSARKVVNLHALYPVLPSSLYVPTATPVQGDFEGDVLVDYLETTKPDSTWQNLVAALLFSCTDYGTLEEFIINIKGSFFITPTVNVEGTTLVRTDSEMDDVVNMFQDVGYKHPDLLALYHLIQYLRHTKDNKIKLASVCFNHPEKTSSYILSQPF